MSEFENLEILGVGSRRGGRFGKVLIAGAGKIEGDVECDELSIPGSGKIEEGGVLTGTGRFGAGMASLTINGTLDFDISGMTESTSPLFTIEMIILGTPSLTV